MWLLIIFANLALFLWMLRKGARAAGREDWIRACWQIRRELVLALVPGFVKRKRT